MCELRQEDIKVVSFLTFENVDGTIVVDAHIKVEFTSEENSE